AETCDHTSQQPHQPATLLLKSQHSKCSSEVHRPGEVCQSTVAEPALLALLHLSRRHTLNTYCPGWSPADRLCCRQSKWPRAFDRLELALSAFSAILQVHRCSRLPAWPGRVQRCC